MQLANKINLCRNHSEHEKFPIEFSKFTEGFIWEENEDGVSGYFHYWNNNHMEKAYIKIIKHNKKSDKEPDFLIKAN